MSDHSILLIDPFKNLINAYQMILKEEGYYPQSATNLDEAYSYLSKAQYSIIIIEYIFPHEATEEFIKKVKRIYPEIYILMIASEIIDNKTYERLFDLGVDEFILKPYSADKILVHIKKGLRQRELIFKMKDLQRLSMLDPVSEKIETLIFNRNFFERSIKRELKRAKRHQHPFSLLLIKVPRVEIEEETFDRFIREFLDLIRRNTREEDVVSKNDGEVGLLLPETNRVGCEAFQQRLYQLIESHTPFQTDNILSSFIKTLSFRSFTFPEHSDILESLKP